MRRTKRFAGFALAVCMGVSLLVNVPAGTVSAAEPTEVVTSPVAGVAEEEVPGATGTDAEALEENQETVYYDASDADEDGFVWDGTTIVKYVGEGGDVKIPVGCTGIGPEAFFNEYSDSSLTSIEIPEGITSIGDFAFLNCSGLASIMIPTSVTSIGDSAFGGCSGLTSIVVSPGNPKYNSTGNCNAIIETETKKLIFGCKNTKITSGVSSIGNKAFYGCRSLTSIEIPEGVTSIGDFVFYGCSGLTSIKIPTSVTSIGEDAFWNCSGLTSIKIPEGVTSIENGVFSDCSGLTSIEIPSSVTSIGYDAFWNCSGLNSIVVAQENKTYNSKGDCNAIIETKTNALILGCKNTKIPLGVTSIGANAFGGCSGLTSIKIPEGVMSIGNGAFYSCGGLTSIEIPSSVTSIEDGAFYSCGGLTSIVVAQENPIYNSKDGCNAIIETETNTLIKGCMNTKIPTSVTSIRELAFLNCSGLTSIEIPSSVTSIEDGAFSWCYYLKIIYGTPGSYAETYAKNKGYEFIDVANKPNTGNTGNAGNTENPVVTPDVTTSYRTHVQKDGWQGFVTNGTMSGTSGQAKRLEGIEIKVEGNKNLGIQYTTHCQTYGWLPWSSNGEMNGTQAEAKRLEAIKIQLTGKDKDKYDVYYRVHAQSYGWLGWAKNGACAGTAGQAKRLEGIQIVVVKRGNPAPGLSYAGVNVTSNANSGKPYVSSIAGDVVIPGDANGTNIMYKTHVQSFGWQNWVLNGTMSGTSGKAKRLEGINIKLSNAQYAGGIEYRTHIQKNGWEQGWKKDGAMSGTSGEAKRLEAIQIRLYGEMAEKYDVYYRVHAQSFGWLGWAKNGEESGTAGLAKRLEGIQIVLVPKGGTAPAANYGNIQSVNVKAYIKK